MIQDYSGRNFQGKSFKGKYLVDANFSYADIRSADFTDAILKGANFSYAKAGLRNIWVIALVGFSLLLSVLSGFGAAFAGYFTGYFLTSETINKVTAVPAITLLVTYGILCSVTIIQGLETAIVTGAFFIAGAGAVIVAVVGNVAGTVTAAITGAGTVAVVGTIAICMAITVAGTVAGIFATATAITAAIIVTVVTADTSIILAAITLALTLVLLSGYVAWRASAGDDKYILVRKIAVVLSAIGGTSFQRADLTDAKFTQATLKCTKFIKANLTRTRFFQSKSLEIARVGKTYLDNPKLQQLVLTGDGQDSNFSYNKLRGVNLSGANLQDASFIGADLSEANLQDANLLRAKLVQTQLDKTDLTGATLTGAYIEDWGITTATKLDRVKCKYVFMRLPTKDSPDPWRKPDNKQEEFGDGDFADFIRPLIITLDLYHNQQVDPRAIAISFKQLTENHPEAELEIVAMERRGQGSFWLRVNTAPGVDRSELSTEYFEYYNRLKGLPKEDLISLLAKKDGQVHSLEVAFRTVTGELKAMAEVPKYDMRGSNFPGGFAETNYGKMVETQYNNMSHDLSQAAAEIQQLLTQLQTQEGYSLETAQQKVASDLATQAQTNPTVMGKLVKWGQSLGDAAAKTTVSEAAKEVVKLALRLSGVPL